MLRFARVGDSDTHGRRGHTAQVHLPVQSSDMRPDPFAEDLRLPCGGAGHGQEELVAAVADQGVGRPRNLGDRPRHLTQHVISGFVSQSVVDALESIEVNHGHGQQPTLVPGLRDRQRQLSLLGPTIAQPGEHVCGGQLGGGLGGGVRPIPFPLR